MANTYSRITTHQTFKPTCTDKQLGTSEHMHIIRKGNITIQIDKQEALTQNTLKTLRFCCLSLDFLWG